MNKGQKVLAGLLGVVAAELAVLDYAAWMTLKNGVTIEVTSEELSAAAEAAQADMGERIMEEGEYVGE